LFDNGGIVCYNIYVIGGFIMKTVIKVFNYIGAGLAAAAALSFFFMGCSASCAASSATDATSAVAEATATYNYIAFFTMAIPICVCLFANHKVDVAACKRDLVVPGIITLIFGTVIGGILMLACPDDVFTGKAGEDTSAYEEVEAEIEAAETTETKDEE